MLKHFCDCFKHQDVIFFNFEMSKIAMYPSLYYTLHIQDNVYLIHQKIFCIKINPKVNEIEEKSLTSALKILQYMSQYILKYRQYIAIQKLHPIHSRCIFLKSQTIVVGEY